MKYKKLFACIISLSLLWMVAFPAFAVSTAHVFANSIQAVPGKTVSIPVKIENNPGLMGFKLTFEYSSKILSSPKVQKGSVTKNGMMNDSITSQTNGSFDVVWSDSSETAENGVLMILQFEVKENASDGKYDIKCTYSQDDTFNEKLESVHLNVSNINVEISKQVNLKTVGEEKTTVTSDTASSDSSKSFSDEVLEKVDSRFVESAIRNALDDFDADSVNDIDENQYSDFNDKVTDTLSSYGADINANPDSLEDYRELYEKAKEKTVIDSVLSSTDSQDIIDVIEETLKKYNAKEISDISAETDKINFTADVISFLDEKGAEIDEDIVERIKIDNISSLYNSAEDTLNSGKAVQKEASIIKKDSYRSRNIIVAFFIVFGVVVCFFLYRNKKRKQNRISKEGLK
ncbi:MAG: hypothetical protein IJJ61_07185 [Clostridia bacterium]|nr:hypothetical protein [Clostridia bacterium]